MFHTLSSLKEYCVKTQLPLEKMRFSLGMNKGRSPRWFFIYRDITGEWVVAKNKDDGTTVERYRGFDESEAVRIIAQKMEEEANKRGLSIYRTLPEENPPIEQVAPTTAFLPAGAGTQDPWENPCKRRTGRWKPVLFLTIILLSITMLVIGLAATMGKTIQGRTERGSFRQSDSPNYHYEYGHEDYASADDIPWWQYWILDAYDDDYDGDYGSGNEYNNDSWYDDFYYGPGDSYDNEYDYGYDYEYNDSIYDDGWDSDDWSDADTDWDSDWDLDWSNDGWTDWDSDW